MQRLYIVKLANLKRVRSAETGDDGAQLLFSLGNGLNHESR